MSSASARTPGLHVPRVVIGSIVAVLAAFIIESSVLPAVGLSSAIPVVFAVVVVLAMAWGPTVGPSVGFGAGLLIDLTGTGTLGVERGGEVAHDGAVKIQPVVAAPERQM